MRCTAYTGSAANNISGQTLHSALKMGRFGTETNTTHDLHQDWRGVTAVIVWSLEMVEIVSRRLADCSSQMLPFGGYDVVVFGDMRQFKPIGGSPLYTGAEAMQTGVVDKRLAAKPEVLAGFTLWQMFKKRIRLVKQNRITDPQLLEIVNAAFEGRGTEDHYNTLNSLRLTYGETRRNVDDKKWWHAPVIVCRNAARAAISLIAARDFARSHSTPLYVVKAIDKGNLQASDSGDAAHPSELRICKGMPVIIRYNIAQQLGVSNGSTGIIRHIELHAEDRILAGLPYSDLAVELRLRHQPQCVWVQVDNCTYKDPTHPQGWVPVVPLPLEIDAKTNTKHKGQHTLIRTQLPMVESFALTGNCVQGKTYDAETICDLTLPLNPPDRAHVGVALSRVRSLDQLAILRTFPISVLQAPMPIDMWCEF